MSLLSVENLKVRFQTNDGEVHAVNNVSFDLEAGKKLALVGESGSGKSQIAFSILGLLAKNGRAEGAINFEGQNLLGLSQKQMNKIRAKDIAMIFQDPMSSLNPYMKIERQLSEVLEIHEGLSRTAARARVLEALDAVKIPDAKNRLSAYPHQFSGGMRQRLVIAMALLCRPKLILADEPTTALDVTVQAQIMELLDDIQRDFGSSILLITHDLGVVAGFCDEVMVLYGGQVMERGTTEAIFEKPTHPYTRGLLRAVPNAKSHDDELYMIPGSPPNMLGGIMGCPFAPRCEFKEDICAAQAPELTLQAPQRACHRKVEELV